MQPESTERPRAAQAARRQSIEPGSQANQYTRRAWVRMFVLGASVRALARLEGVGEAEIQQELRERILAAGMSKGGAM